MLYIASAQPPTPIIQSILVDGLTAPGTSSLVVAKPDRVEVWDVGPNGLTWKADLEVWGSVIGIEKVITKNARPHILVLLGPPNAQVLVLAFSPATSSIVVTSSAALNPPTPTLREAEFFRGIIADGYTVLVSLWVGVISCVELEIEKDKDLKRRRSSAVAAPVDVLPEKRLRAKEPFNINIREQNLLSLAFHPGQPTAHGPVVSMLWLSPSNQLRLQFRAISTTEQSFHNLGKDRDVVWAESNQSDQDEDTDFGSIPFACPGARHIIPVPGIDDERLALVVGDEFSVLYSFSQIGERERTSSISQSTSPRASAVNRSPQTEARQIGKRRKSSTSEGGRRWELKPIWRMRQGFGTVLAATALESTTAGGSVLMSDDSGRLIAFPWVFEYDSNDTRSVRVALVDLGTASPASSLTRISPSHLFLASANGDSSLLSFDLPTPGPPTSPSIGSGSRRKSKSKREASDSVVGDISVGAPTTGGTQVLERWMNLAPVKDFCVVGEEGGGSSHLIVACGSSNANSLRIVKSGAGLEQIVHLDGIDKIERMWTLYADGILLSTATTSSILALTPKYELVDLPPSFTSLPTLAAAVLPDCSLLFHVNTARVTLWSDVMGGHSQNSWQAPAEITSAHIHRVYAVLSTKGGKVHLIRGSQDEEPPMEPIASVSVDSEVTVVAILTRTDQISPAIARAGQSSPVIAVGTWANEILIYTLESIKTSAEPLLRISESVFAKSLILKRSPATGADLQLLAGLSDGSLITYDIDVSDEDYSTTGRKASSLGNQPLALHPIQGSTTSGDEKLLAIGISDRMSILFENRDRVEFSSVSLAGIVAASAVEIGDEGDCLVLATATGLTITKVSGLKKLHIQTMDTGHRSSHKLAWMPDYKILAAGAVERRIDQATGDIWEQSYIEIKDQAALNVLSETTLAPREEVACVADVLLLGRHYLAVGLAVHAATDDTEAIYEDVTPAAEGRLLLLEPVHDQTTGLWAIKDITQVKTIGAVRAITTIHGYLAFAASSTVMIHKFEDGSLTELSRFSSTFVAQCLYTAPPWRHQAQEKLVVGDGMRSVIVLEIDDESGMIFDDRRDMATHQISTMSKIRDRGQGAVIADGYNNIMTFRLREQIEPGATFGLHEEITAFRQGSFAPPTSAADIIAPDLLYATSDGRLGMIGELSVPAAKILDDLQRNMDKYQKGPGGVSWRTFRRGGKPLVPRETAGFIDGDFVQKFLNMDFGVGQIGDKVLKGGNVHEQVNKLGDNGKPEGASRADVARVLEATAGLH